MDNDSGDRSVCKSVQIFLFFFKLSPVSAMVSTDCTRLIQNSNTNVLYCHYTVTACDKNKQNTNNTYMVIKTK